VNQEQVSFLQMYARGTPSTCSIRISYTDRGNAYGICSARVVKCLHSDFLAGADIALDQRIINPMASLLSSDSPFKRDLCPPVSSYPMTP
jgi:hypothetical protein